MKMKIKLSSPEDTASFVNICNEFESDVDVWDGHISIDAKSIVGMLRIADGKIITANIHTSDPNEIKAFIDMIRKFEVN